MWVLFSFFYYKHQTGIPFEFATADAWYYDRLARLGSMNFWIGNFNIYGLFKEIGVGLSDRGYPLYLSIVYILTGNSIFIARILKAIISAYTCLMVYNIARRNFGFHIARTAGVMCMLLPNLIYYTGLHVKETEMLFLTLAFVNQADLLIRNRIFNFKNILLTVSLGASLFLFRTVLGVAAFFSLFTALVFTSNRIIGLSKKVLIGFWVVVLLLIFAGSAVKADLEKYWGGSKSNQELGMVYKTNRDKGNKFAKYGKTSIFAPIILIAPFPTFVDIPHQKNIMLLSGAYYIRNIYAFFVLIALTYFLRKRRYKNHLLIITMALSYLAVLAMSNFALSERFHMPVVPLLLILAAVGIHNFKPHKKQYFYLYLVFTSVVIIGWNWFKLAGRDMI